MDASSLAGEPQAQTGPRRSTIAFPDTVRFWLRAEGLAAFIAGIVTYGWLGGDWLWLLPVLLLPDLSMVGYVAGPAVGAATYNAVHNWAVGLAVLGLGIWLDASLVATAGAVLIAHVGMDRVAGYGLKHITGFKDTHLQRA